MRKIHASGWETLVRGLRDLDWIVLGCTLLILVFGLLTLYSAAQSPSVSYTYHSLLWIKQLIWILIGFLSMIFFYYLDFYSLVEYIYPLYFIALGLLVLVLVLGRTTMGAQRWFNLGFMLFQPSELAKLTVILMIGRYVVEHHEQMHTFKNFVFPLLYALPPLVLIYFQPDLGTALLLLPLALILLYIGGARLRYLVSLLILFFAGLPFVWFLLRDYQKSRLMAFLRPEMDPLGGGYSIIQSIIAIGSGGVFGKGWLMGTQIHRDFIPQHHTDFIFAVIGEELGFAGSFVLLFLFLMLLMQGLKICKQAREPLGRILACGVVCLFGLQIFINIGMTVGLMPITGLPLPFLSYGGSSLLINMSALGILLNVNRRTMRRRR